jgi:hypothetical protein
MEFIREEEFENINFIFFRSYNEKYYSYAINGMDSFHLIPRELIESIIKTKSMKNLERVQWLSCRFFPFVYDCKEDTLI